MHRRTTALALATLALAATPLAGHAGSAADPEVTDPAGDAPWIHPGGTNADWADLTGVWFTSSDTGAEEAFTVHVGVVGGLDHPDQDAALLPGWELVTDDGVRCTGSLFIWATDPEDVVFDRGAELSYRCDGDETHHTVPLADVTVSLASSFQVALPVESTGEVVSVTVPLASFSEGGSVGRYHAGAVLLPTLTTSAVVYEAGITGASAHADATQHPCPGLETVVLCFEGRGYTIGS